MAIVEDYIPDSDDEDISPPSAVVDPPIPERPAQQANGGVTKGSTVPELLELLRVPREFNDTLRSEELSELMWGCLGCEVADSRYSGRRS
jgi:hypothetical protein